MSGEAWLTLAVAIVVMIVLVRALLPPSAAFVAAMVAVMAMGIVEPREALSGFSNPAPFTIAAVYVIARAVQKTGALTPVVGGMFDSNLGIRQSLARLCLTTSAASAFMNTTPIVAMLVPQVERWSEERGWSPSLFLMPLSFAAILGGVLTLIGTATNLVVSGLFEASGLEPLGFFEITKIGLPVAVVGLGLIVLLAPVVIPTRRSARSEITGEFREFVTEMEVEPGGALDGRTVAEAGLRQLKSVFLVQIDRAGTTIAPVGPDTRLEGGDHVRFVGSSDRLIELQALRGLSADDHVGSVDAGGSQAYFEAVIGGSSPLVGQTLRAAGFRGAYQAAVLAIHRAGHLIDAKLGSVPLRVGDTLLILADPGFRDRWQGSHHFLLIAPLTATPPVGTGGAVKVAAVIAGVAAFAATGSMDLVAAVLVGAVALVLLRVLTPSEAMKAVNLDVVVMIAAALGFAQAMVASGLASEVAALVVDGFEGLGERGLLLGVVLATVVLREFITNNAAALLIFPIAVTTANALDYNPRAFGMAVAIAAATTFLTPIGYQTNVMVYGPGGYRFTDYLRLGLPLTVMTVIVTVILIPVFWPT